MKFLVVVGLLGSAYSSDKYDQGEIRNKERRIAGGGNFGGFIGLTTYPAGPFLVAGKYEKYGPADRSDAKENDAKVIAEGNVGYDNMQENQPFGNGILKEGKNKEDEYIEYLGYRGGIGYCVGEYEDSYENNKYDETDYRNGQNVKNDNKNFSSVFNQEINKRCDRLFGYTGPTANDEPENLIRPCALDDWQCIRKYFAANSNCKPAYGPIPDPVYFDVTTGFFPHINVTIAAPNFMIGGLSTAKISEFYVNKQSGNLVLVLNIMVLNETVPRAYFRYRRTAKESIVLADYLTNSFRGIIMTAVIPKVPHLRLDLADIHPDVQDSTPRLVVGPGAYNSTDPDVVSAFSQFGLLLPISIREGQVFRAALLTSIYIQNNICDFGLKLISV